MDLLPNMKITQIAQKLGLLTIKKKVVMAIIHREASQIPGIIELGGRSIFKRIFKRLGLRTRPRGVELELGEGEAAMNIRLVVRYGVSIPELSDQLRERISRALKTMCGIEVRTINIYVESIKNGYPLKQKEEKPTLPRFHFDF
jgi:uncharacterized alkaline shock family protein YloU